MEASATLHATRRIEVHRHVLALGEALEHPFERELTADAALLVAAIGMAGCLADALVDLYPAAFDRGTTLCPTEIPYLHHPIKDSINRRLCRAHARVTSGRFHIHRKGRALNRNPCDSAPKRNLA